MRRKLRKEAAKPNPFDKEKFLISPERYETTTEDGTTSRKFIPAEYAPLSNEEEDSITMPEGSLWNFQKTAGATKSTFNIYEVEGHTLKLIMTREISKMSVDEGDETFKPVKKGSELTYRVARNTRTGDIEPRTPFYGANKSMVKLHEVDGNVLRRVNLVKSTGKTRKFGASKDEPYNP
jgi:hypothetical protein